MVLRRAGRVMEPAGRGSQPARKGLDPAGWCTELAWRAMELGERVAFPAGSAFKLAGTTLLTTQYTPASL